MQQQVGDKLVQHFMENTGGLNLSDSTFQVKDSQAIGGFNYEYMQTGGILKSLCPARINSVANAQLRTLGLFLRNTKTSGKSIIRAAGTKLQLATLGGAFTDLTDDTVSASSTFLASGSTKPAVGSMFITPSTDVLWVTGGGASLPYGVYSDSKVTANGSAAPTGAITATVSGGGGAWSTPGTYFYAVAKRKLSTGAISNAALDVSATTTSITDSVVIDLSSISNLDTTRDDKVYLYRSAVGGVTAFTSGDLVAEINSTTTSYTDTGSTLASSENIPRSGNTVLDNGTLPSGTYETLAVWKRRLVTASGSTIYISDINKPESWPASNTIDIPSGGKITGLAIISFSPNAASTDEFLAVFKETEVWIIAGTSLSDWELKFVDYAGTLSQSLIVSANGYLYFLDNRGVYLWDGLGKPIYISRPIETLWGQDGKLDRSKLGIGSGQFFRRQNEVVWYLSHTDTGEQTYVLKLDLRLTLPQVGGGLSARMLDGVFLQGKVNNPVYAAASFIFPTSSNQEDVLISGDDAGYIYRQFYSTSGVGSNDYDWTYDTKYLDMGKPGREKQFYQVIVWVENIGNWSVTLDYWTNWRSSDAEANTVPVTLVQSSATSTSLWDVGQWDVAQWDNFTAKPQRLVFNLRAQPYNNNVGEVIKLRFRNQSSDQPVLIYGFSVVYADLGMRT